MPKPSFGCRVCRWRRIKCDERPGGCANCDRYGVPCPGYPNSFDVLHRHHVAMPPVSTFGYQQRAVPAAAEISPFGYTDSKLPTADLQLNDEEFSLAVYYACYCIDGTSRCSSDELRREGNGCLFAAAKLMGYQAMVQKWDVADADSLLHRSYMTAIGLLNEALSTENERRRDSTLLTVILMGAVETKACSDQSTKSWVAHSWGASTLLQIRGPLQVTNVIGSAMFFQATHQIFTSCLLGKCHAPPGFVELSRAIEEYVIDPAYPLWRYHMIMIRLIDFLASIPNDLQVSLTNATQVEDILRDAMAIQSDMIRLFAEAPQIWQHRTTECHDYGEVTIVAQIHGSITAAQMWNGRRIATVKLYSVIKQICAHQQILNLQIDRPSMDDLAINMLNQAAIECLEAAPQVLQIAKARTQQAILHPDMRICHDAQLSSYGYFVQAQSNETRLPHLQACLLQWSVYFAAQCVDVHIQIRRRLLFILNYVGDAMHVQQWKLLADRLRPELA